MQTAEQGEFVHGKMIDGHLGFINKVQRTVVCYIYMIHNRTV